MENGTVRIFINGQWHEGKAVETEVRRDGFAGMKYIFTLTSYPQVMEPQPTDGDHPAPFSDGEYLHYTWFHPQLKDMIGTEGHFYDVAAANVGVHNKKMLFGVNSDGFPYNKNRASYAYFAVPIKPEKTEVTLQEVADKFGVAVEQLRIKE